MLTSNLTAPFASSLHLMSVRLPTARLTADILATLALKMGAEEVVVSGPDIAYRTPNCSQVPKSLDSDDVSELLIADFDQEDLADFMWALQEGRLRAIRYNAVKGSLYKPNAKRALLRFPLDAIIRRYNPTAESLLERGASNSPATSDAVPLTKDHIFVATLRNIPSTAFQQALTRLLGIREIPNHQVVWLRGHKARLIGHRIMGPLMLSLQQPHMLGAIEKSEQVPSIPFQYHNGSWYLIREAIRGANATIFEEQLLHTDWGLKVKKGSFFWRPVTVPRKKRERKPSQGATTPMTDPVSPALRDPLKAKTIPPDGLVVALTRTGIPLTDLHRIAAADFNLAVQWALGNRQAQIGDRIVITAGRQFQRAGKLVESLLICPELPFSRRGMEYPKVHLSYYQGAWHIVANQDQGLGGAKMAATLLSIKAWAIQAPPVAAQEPPAKKVVSPPPAAPSITAVAAPQAPNATPRQASPELSPAQHEMLAALLFITGAVSIEIEGKTCQMTLSNQIAAKQVGRRREHQRPLKEEKIGHLLYEDFSAESVAALLQSLQRRELQGVQLIAEQSPYFQQLIRDFDPIHPALRGVSKLISRQTADSSILLTKPDIHVATFANIDRIWFERAVACALALHEARHGDRLIITAERNGLHYNHLEGSIRLRRDDSPYRGEQGPWIPLLYHHDTWVLPLAEVRGSHGPALAYLLLRRDWSIARHGDKFHRPHYHSGRMDYTDAMTKAIMELEHVRVISDPL